MSKISDTQLKQLLEAAIFVNEGPLSVDKMRATILSDLKVSVRQLNATLNELTLDYVDRGIKLEKVASGYRFVSDTGLGQLLSRLWQETVPKYSRAMLETLALIAYKQPITRGEIEDIRGVAVSSHIIRSLTERQWIKVVGHKEVPGRPSLLATTATFLDYFALSSLNELPSADVFADNIVNAMEASQRVNLDEQAELPEHELLQKDADNNTMTENEASNSNAQQNNDNPDATQIKAKIH